MTDIFASLAIGFSAAATPMNLFYCFIGALLGTLIGVLPGVGPIATIAMLLPITFNLDPTGAIIMLSGIYYGAQYGGSTTAILINLPGESSSVVTALDGNAMAKNGEAGAALAIAAIGSFVAGSLATVMIAVLSPPLSRLAGSFGAAEYFSLMLLGLLAAITLAAGSLLKAAAMLVLGLLLGMVGTDVTSGAPRYSFGLPELADGIGFVALSVGVFACAEIIGQLALRDQRPDTHSLGRLRLMPSLSDLRASAGPILRGTGLGSVLGVLPGGGAVLAAFSSYALEKKLAKDPSRFGRGAIEGVAGPESANNAGAQTSFIPLLTLGVPSNAVMALMVGALMIQGITPGPDIIEKQPTLFWGLIASMWIGNLMLVIINLPLVGLWVRLLRVPYRLMYPAILLFSGLGVYTLNNTAFDVFVAAGCGLAGYFLVRLGFEMAPLILGFVIGPLLEEYLRRALLLSRGDLMTFVERPLSATLIGLAVLMIVVAALPNMRSKRDTIFKE
jgi:putative tricarboxylic transport membrane protein